MSFGQKQEMNKKIEFFKELKQKWVQIIIKRKLPKRYNNLNHDF